MQYVGLTLFFMTLFYANSSNVLLSSSEKGFVWVDLRHTRPILGRNYAGTRSAVT